MPTAVIVLEFDPLLRVGDASVRIATLALAAVIAAAILLAAWIASTTPAHGADEGAFAHRPRLRLDDLLFIVLGIVPGAVIGGRIDHVMAHAAYYAANPAAIVDPAVGSLGLGLAVVGGVASGAFVARLLESPVGRWAHVAALPTLVVLAGGRAAQVLSGDGQGRPADTAWATSYAGPGPWGSLAPALPSHPSQAYEAILLGGAIVVLGVLLAAGAFGRRDGRALAAAIALWGIARLLAATTWRDAPVLWILNIHQVVALLIVGGSVAALVLGRRVAARLAVDGDGQGEPRWPDPATRPRF